MTVIALTGAIGVTALTFGAAATSAPTAARPASTPTSERAAVVQSARTRLGVLEAQADVAGAAAQRADEAVLQHDTAANRAAATAARTRLVALAARQTPELTALATRLNRAGAGVTATADGATATTTALVGRTRALRAVSYAEKQVGDPYGYASAGPGRWDCSGLTMRSYQAAHVGIGGHSATAQWRQAQREHRLVSYSHRRRGDLIFYGSPGAVYHVAMYVGNGRMVEAPYPGKDVRVVAVRSAGRLAQVGRPA